MVIWSLASLHPRHLFSMNITIRWVVVNAQASLAVRKLAFSALGRSLQFSHHHSFLLGRFAKQRNYKFVFICGLEDFLTFCTLNCIILGRLFQTIFHQVAISQDFLRASSWNARGTTGFRGWPHYFLAKVRVGRKKWAVFPVWLVCYMIPLKTSSLFKWPVRRFKLEAEGGLWDSTNRVNCLSY